MAANVVVKVVMVLVRALEQIRSRAPSCLVSLFLLLPPVSFFSFLSFVFPSLSFRFLPSFFFLIEPSPLQLLTRVFGGEAEWEDAAVLNVVKVEAVVAANVVVKVVMVLVRALEQIRSRAPSCLVLLFLLLPPVSFFSFLSFFHALSFFVPYTILCDFLAIFLLVWFCFPFFSLIFLSAY